MTDCRPRQTDMFCYAKVGVVMCMMVLVEGCVCLLCSIRALQHTFCPLWGIMLCIAGEPNRGYAMLCRYAFESLPSGRLSETRDDQDESRGWELGLLVAWHEKARFIVAAVVFVVTKQ